MFAVVGRPDAWPATPCRACLLAAVVVGVLLGPLSRRIAAASGRLVYGSEGPRRELLDQFAHGLGRAAAPADVLQQLVEAVRPACAADAAEVWLHRDGRLALAHASPVFAP